MVRDLCRWFYHLEGVANGLLDHPPVHVFVTVYNRWCAEEEATGFLALLFPPPF